MDEDATWYGSRPLPRPHCVRRGPSSARNWYSSPPIFSARVYCGHGRPSQLLLSSYLLFCGLEVFVDDVTGEVLLREVIRHIMAARAIHNIFKMSEFQLIITNNAVRFVRTTLLHFNL